MMDARIGTLNNGQYYAFVNGYDMPEFRGTLEEVEIALGVRPARAASVQTFNVVMTLEFPAWDEVGGIDLGDFPAKSKSEAVSMARRQAIADGHASTGKGRYWFKATEND